MPKIKLKKGQKILLGKSKLREDISALRAALLALEWLGKGVAGVSLPGPEIGRPRELSNKSRFKNPSDTRTSKTSPKTSGRKKDRRWRPKR